MVYSDFIMNYPTDYKSKLGQYPILIKFYINIY